MFDFASQMLVPAYSANATAPNGAFGQLGCNDALDYVTQYSETMANDPVGAAFGPNCPVQGDNGSGGVRPGPTTFTCNALCNSDITMILQACRASDWVQWDFNGQPPANNPSAPSIAAPPGTFIQAQTAWTWFLSGQALGPNSNNTGCQTVNGNQVCVGGVVAGAVALSGDAPFILSDPSCVANTNMTNTSQLADWPPVTMTCAAATTNLVRCASAVVNPRRNP